MQNSSKIWDNLFSRGEFIWKEPHDLVVELLPILEKIGAKRILDLGCGAGRHLVFLSDHGFISHGTDIAFIGLKSAKNWLIKRGFDASLSQSEMHHLPYASKSFDALVCLYVIYHGTVERIRRAFQEIYRVLKPGGMSLVTFISDRHHRFGHGERIEKNTFITNIGADAGVPHHFCGREELFQLVRDFEVVQLDLLERMIEEGLRVSHWAMLLKKVVNEQAFRAKSDQP